MWILNFKNLKLPLWHIRKTIKKIKNENKNKEDKHTCNSVEGGFDKTFYYKQDKLK